MIAALLDHLWQSTIFAAGIGLLTLALRGNPARIRYRLWFLASVKFLVPFSLLQALGGALAPAMPPAAMPDLYFIQRTTEPFAAAAPSIVLPTPHGLAPPMLLLLLWLCGFSAVLLVWFVRWLRMRFDPARCCLSAGRRACRSEMHRFFSGPGTVRHFPAGFAFAARHHVASDEAGNARHPGP